MEILNEKDGGSEQQPGEIREPKQVRRPGSFSILEDEEERACQCGEAVRGQEGREQAPAVLEGLGLRRG